MRRILYFGVLIFTTTLISCEDSKEKIGNQVIEKIENFRVKNNRLPERLDDIGVEEKLEGPIFYEKKSADEYEIYYGLELGESRTYNSKTKKWK